MLRYIVLATCIAVSVSAHAQSREDSIVLVEGHVFNLRTGTPIQGALVRVGSRPVAPTTVTDQNGFYSLEVDLEFHDSIVAHCRFQPRRGPEVTHTSSSSLPTLLVASLRRDFYLDVSRKAAPLRCLPAFILGG